jgi:uncharacterized protein (DUF488 family)
MSSERKPGKTVYTLGTSTRSPEEFISLLKSYGIEVMADVRSFPTSRFEQFTQRNLAALVEGVGIHYVYLGKELGGYRKTGYVNYMATADFQAGLRRLERLSRARRTVFVCAERLPWKCHRRFIAGELEKRGWQIVHIIDGKRTWQPAPRLPL